MSKDELYNRAYDLFEEQRFAEAIGILASLHIKCPDDSSIAGLLANCHLKIHHFTDAARILMDADRAEPGNPEIKYNLGYALLCMGRVNDAMKAFDESLRFNPQKEVKKRISNIFNHRAEFEAKMENNYDIPLEDEFECYDMFIEAQQCLYSGKCERAISLYEKILLKKPYHSNTIDNIGVAYVMLKEPQKAMPYLEKALSLSPKDEIAIVNMAHAHFLLGNAEKSSQYVEEMMTIIKNPPLRDLIRLLTALIDMGQYKHARELINKGEHPQITFLSGVLYAKEKDYVNAKAEFFKVKGISEMAKRYYGKTGELISGKIKGFQFEAKVICSDIEMQ